MDNGSLFIFALGSFFGVIMSYCVSDLVFPTIEYIEEDETDSNS